MRPIAMIRRALASVRRFVGSHEPRLVRRVEVECPHGRGRVEIDLLVDRAGKPTAVVRCSAHQACPPTCDQACRHCADVVLAPAHALVVYPHDGPLDDVG